MSDNNNSIGCFPTMIFLMVVGILGYVALSQSGNNPFEEIEQTFVVDDETNKVTNITDPSIPLPSMNQMKFIANIFAKTSGVLDTAKWSKWGFSDKDIAFYHNVYNNLQKKGGTSSNTQNTNSEASTTKKTTEQWEEELEEVQQMQDDIVNIVQSFVGQDVKRENEVSKYLSEQEYQSFQDKIEDFYGISKQKVKMFAPDLLTVTDWILFVREEAATLQNLRKFLAPAIEMNPNDILPSNALSYIFETDTSTNENWTAFYNNLRLEYGLSKIEIDQLRRRPDVTIQDLTTYINRQIK